MKIFLDDKRDTPDGFIRCWWPDEVITILQKREPIEVLSLDHDLGDDSKGTGYTVLKWLEEQVFFDRNFPIPNTICIHSANPVGRMNMEAALCNIKKMIANRD